MVKLAYKESKLQVFYQARLWLSGLSKADPFNLAKLFGPRFSKRYTIMYLE